MNIAPVFFLTDGCAMTDEMAGTGHQVGLTSPTLLDHSFLPSLVLGLNYMHPEWMEILVGIPWSVWFHFFKVCVLIGNLDLTMSSLEEVIFAYTSWNQSEIISIETHHTDGCSQNLECGDLRKKTYLLSKGKNRSICSPWRTNNTQGKIKNNDGKSILWHHVYWVEAKVKGWKSG